ncbi:MAG: ankyrin repeat domain-containing protein [Spirochaetaceae bacterium]|nr:ankyrin repeat domain-containing protein [Spirochaetaceae bacterium]
MKSNQGEAARFLDLACLTYGNDSTDRVDRARRMLADRPSLAAVDAHTAAATGDVEALRRILGGDARRASASGGPRRWPPLLYLCYSRVTEQLPEADAIGAARLLIEHGADPNAHFMWGRTYRFTALTGAMGEGEGGIASQPPHPHAPELAELLLDAGADPNDAQGLYNTMFRPDNRWLHLLLDRGLTARDRINWKTGNRVGTLDFLLGHAATKGFADRVELLLRHGADPRGSSYYNGRTHYENALLHGFGDVAALLRRAGATPTELSPEDRFRAACMSGDEAAARAALDAAPQSLSGPEPLHTAASLGNVDAVRCLLNLGADPNATAKDGTTALHHAGWNDRREVAEVLVAHGARPLRDADHGSSPAGWADHAGHAAMRDYLIDHCTDGLDLVSFGRAVALQRYLSEHPGFATSVTPGGGSPLHHLRDDIDDLEPVVDALLEAGADLGARDSRKETAQESAVRRGEPAVAALLSR